MYSRLGEAAEAVGTSIRDSIYSKVDFARVDVSHFRLSWNTTVLVGYGSPDCNPGPFPQVAEQGRAKVLKVADLVIHAQFGGTARA